MGKRRRFDHLERARGGAPEGKAGSSVSARFGAVEPPRVSGELPAAAPPPDEGEGSPPPSRVSARFAEERPPAPERPLELADAPAGATFVRCVGCGADNGHLATGCFACGADLMSAAQREANVKLWRELAEKGRAREAELAAAAEARRQAPPPELPLPRRAGDRDGGPVGLRLLRLIPSPAARLAVALGAVALPVLLMATSPWGSGPSMTGFVLLIVIVSLFTPARRRRRRWWMED